MLQDKKGGTPKVNTPDITEAATQLTGAVVGKASEQAGGKVKKAASVAGQAMAYGSMAQQAGAELFNSPGGRGSGSPGVGQGINGSIGQTRGNADAIASNAMFGVSHLVGLVIFVEGKEIPHYKHFQLYQCATGHHDFTLVLSHDALGTPQDHEMEDVQKMLGKRITVTISYKNLPDGKGPERAFIGVVTEIGF
ncbi:MAG: hypothetical protein ACK5LJ_09890, partial [Paracoccus sp. (in: a-proteobacteria)]